MARIFPALLAVFFALVPFASCSKDKDPGTEKLRPVTLRLQWLIQTQFAGYYVALEKGYYKEAGLDVRIEEGSYGKNNLATVSEGLEEFGTKWIFDLMPQAERIVILANIMKDNGLLFVSKNNSGIRSVRDFAGRRVSVWFIGNEYQLFAMLDNAGVPRNLVNIVAQHFDLSQFLKDEVDVIAAMSYNEVLQLQKTGYPADTLSIIDPASVGASFPGDSIFTSRSFFEKNPETCKKFVEASIRGWEYAIRYPEEATRIVLNHDKKGRLGKEQQLDQMINIIKLIRSDRWPVGTIDTKSLSNTVYFARRYGFLKTDLPMQSLYWKARAEKQ